MAARIDNGRAQLLTRTGLDWTDKYPSAIAALSKPRNVFPESSSSAAFVDPYIAIDPSFVGARDYTILTSSGIGNSSAIPEPSTWTMMLIGLVALARWALALRESHAPIKAGRSVLRRFTAKVLTDRFANRQQKGPKQPDDTRDLLAKLRLR